MIYITPYLKLQRLVEIGEKAGKEIEFISAHDPSPTHFSSAAPGRGLRQGRQLSRPDFVATVPRQKLSRDVTGPITKDIFSLI